MLFFLSTGCDIHPEDSSIEEEWQLSSIPADGDVAVSRLAGITIELDRMVHAHTVNSNAIWITSGESVAFYRLFLEPYSRQIIVEFDPIRPLRPYTTYLLFVDFLIDLDNNIQPESYQAFFRTGEELGEPAKKPEVQWNDIEQIFNRSCVNRTCHGADRSALGLDLSSVKGIERSAISVPSRQMSTGFSMANSTKSAFSFIGFTIIDVIESSGRPASSYMMYKILGDTHILGEPMPPPRTDSEEWYEAKLQAEEIKMISYWIRYGAQMN